MQGSQDTVPEQPNYECAREQGPPQQHGAGWNPNGLPAEDSRHSTLTIDLRSFKKPGEKMYTQRSRLFVGNLPAGVTEQDVEKLFSKYGKPAEIFINKERGFGFVRLETRILAEIAKTELDDFALRGRQLRVRFAAHGAALTVKNLPQFVSNELLEEAFSTFGQVERAVVIVDDRGRSTGKGVVEFTSKAAARKALERCAEGAFLLTAYPRPVTVEPMDQLDEDEGQPERVISKNQQFHKEREQPPRFAQPGTFEYEYAMRWKALLDMEKQQQEQVDRNIREAREKLKSEMVAAQHEHQVMLMRQDLLRRQEELRRMEEQHNLEVQKRKQVEMRQEEERRRRSEEAARRQQEAFAENREKDMRIHMSGQGMAVSRTYMAGSTLPAGPVNMPDVEKPLMHERFPVEQAVSDAMLGAVPPFPRGLSTPPDFGLNKRRGY